MERMIGRILVGDEWRPACTVGGITYVAPDTVSPWRTATTEERATWQTRRDPYTVGRVWDSACYYC